MNVCMNVCVLYIFESNEREILSTVMAENIYIEKWRSNVERSNDGILSNIPCFYVITFVDSYGSCPHLSISFPAANLYRLSHLWYGGVGILFTLVIGWAASVVGAKYGLI